MMSRLMLVLLTVTGLGCAVDRGPQRTPAPDDETGAQSRSAVERTASPHGTVCPQFPPGSDEQNLGCLSDDDCVARGGSPTNLMCRPGGHCCVGLAD
jgi:hypothetical protein